MLELPLNTDFTHKVVVVTGAGGVLCGTMARAFAQAGAKVAALDLNQEAVEKLAEEVQAEGFILRGYRANVLEAEELEEIHQQILSDLGPCDILALPRGLPVRAVPPPEPNRASPGSEASPPPEGRFRPRRPPPGPPASGPAPQAPPDFKNGCEHPC